jgi:O-antigen/teichoic acid export membrane protein
MKTIIDSLPNDASLADVKASTVRGGAIALAVQAIKFVSQAGSVALLARLLDPDHFGLVGMVTGITGIFVIFKDAGLSMATVQREHVTHEQVSTLFWCNMAVGVVLATMTAGMAPALVAFYHEPRLFPITIALGSMFIFTAASVQHQALLQRRMRFAVLGVIDVVSVVVSVSVGIGLAIAGLRYWALVGMTIGLPLANVLCLWIANPWRPGRPRRGANVRSMLRFGGTVTLNQILVYIAYNADRVLLGRYWGATVLGVYGRAQALVNLPTSQLNSAIGSVALPTLSRLQSDPDRRNRYFLQGYELVLSLTVPITLTSIIFAHEIIQLLLGPKWLGAVPTFRLLAPATLAIAFINPFGWLLFARGQVERSLYMSFVLTPSMLLAYFLGLHYGAVGVATGYSAVMAVITIPFIQWSRAGGSITAMDVVHSVKRPIGAGLLASCVGVALELSITAEMAFYFRLVIGAGLTLLTYAWLLLIVMHQKDFYYGLVSNLLLPKFRRSSKVTV